MVFIKHPHRRTRSRRKGDIKSATYSSSIANKKSKQIYKSRRRQLPPRRHPPLRELDREELAQVAEETLSIIEAGSYVDALTGSTHEISSDISASMEETCIYSSSSTGLIDNWRDGPRLLSLPPSQQTHIKFLAVSPLKAARELSLMVRNTVDANSIGFLNCSSAKRPGGSFTKGGTEQEECLARASTISASLTSLVASPFYRAHRHDDAAGMYDHQVIYTPRVTVFREDRRLEDKMETGGGILTPPFRLSVVSTCAINTQQLHNRLKSLPDQEVNDKIENVMRARMARILRVFEERGIRCLLLTPFGVGRPFNNNVETVARIWAELLACPNAAFRHVFDRVWFALDYGQPALPQRFELAFRNRVFEDEFTLSLTEDADGEDWERVF